MRFVTDRPSTQFACVCICSQCPATHPTLHRCANCRHPQVEILSKPHGHGDAHSLLHSLGIAEKWSKQGRKFLLFFQDTNPLSMRSLAAAVGVSYLVWLKRGVRCSSDLKVLILDQHGCLL